MAKVETENTKQNELLNKIYKTEKEIKFSETILKEIQEIKPNL